MGDLLCGIDTGTTGTKVVLCDSTGKARFSVTREYPLHTPQPLWAEQEPQDWWDAACLCLREASDWAKREGHAIVALGPTGQMHGSVFLDADGEVIRPAILWCDQRTDAQCRWIVDTVGEETVHSETLNPPLCGFTLPKIIWLRDNEPESYSRVAKVLLPKDFVRYRLTGEFFTEVSDASGTSLLNVPQRRWSEAMISGCGLSESLLPEVVESPTVCTHVNAEGAQATGLEEGTPVVGGAGDQAAGGVGNGVVRAGVVSSTIGTSGVVFAYAEKPRCDPQMRTHTFCHAVPGAWHVMGVMLSAGGSLRWFRDEFCESERVRAEKEGVDPYEIVCAEAEAVPPGCEGLIFLPYLSGERTPYPDPHARGVFYGITLRHKKQHFIRAILEGVAFGLADSFRIIRDMGVEPESVVASGGGARSALWVQICADASGVPHGVNLQEEGPALGAALLAGVGVGMWNSVPEACAAAVRVGEETHPRGQFAGLMARQHEQYTRLYSRLREEFAASGEAP